MDLENKVPEEEKDKNKKPVEETAEKPVTEQPAPDDKQADENGEGAAAVRMPVKKDRARRSFVSYPFFLIEAMTTLLGASVILFSWRSTILL